MEQTPGQNTRFFIVLEGVVTGPLIGLDSVRQYNIRPDTPVWYEGLDDWQPAIMAPLTRMLFMAGSFHVAGAGMGMAPVNPVRPPEIPRPPVISSETPGEEAVETSETEDEKQAESHRERSPEPECGSERRIAPVPPVIPAAEPVADSIPPRPNTYLAWAIVVTVICNPIAGVIAIIYACKVRSKYARGIYESAQRCSETAQWWIAGSITLGLIMTVFNLMTGGLL